jgi:LCP family protein required for cell wall assembly
LAIIIFLSIGIVKAFKGIDFSGFLSLAGTELQKDPQGHTNFLIMGIGGGVHDGADLTDSIIVASLDPDTNALTMLSIPRDLYVKDDLLYDSRINEVYSKAKEHFGSSAQGLEYAKNKIEELLGVPIHYWIKVDFQGFKQLIDAIGGVDVVVTEDLNDPFYPKDGTYLYDPFNITKGPHHLDGENALKYARSRETTSDFDRARRQQQIIFAIKEKTLSTGTLLDKGKIQNILDVLKSNIETNITVKEILTLGGIAPSLSQDKIVHRLIHDDPGLCGGLLYTPNREDYNGMFILITAGGPEYLYRYVDLNFNFADINPETTTIQILNGTPRVGVAAETKQVLRRYCFDIVRFGNASTKALTQTTYYYRQKTDANGNIIKARPKALDYLEKLIPGKESTEIPVQYSDSTAEIILEIGSDYTTSDKYIEDPFYALPLSETQLSAQARAAGATTDTNGTIVPAPTTTTPETAPTPTQP